MAKKAKDECKCNENNQFVGIGASLGGILLVMVLFLALFAEGQMWVAVPMAFCFMVMTIALGYFASKKQ